LFVLEREKERESESMCVGRGRRESPVDSTLNAKPHVGLDPMTHEIMT